MTAAAEIREYLELAAWVAKNCGTGAGGFQPGNRCAHGGTPNLHRRAHGRWRAQERRRKPLNAEHADWIRHWKGERRDTARYVRKERRTLRKEQRAERRTLHRESQRDIRKLKARHARETAGSKNPARTAERHREERGDLASRIREERREKHGEQAEERATARQDHRDHVHDALETIRTEHAEILRGRREDRQEARERLVNFEASPTEAVTSKPTGSMLGQSTETARAMGVAVESSGYARIEGQYGRRAENVPALYDVDKQKIYLNETHPYWQDPDAYTAKKFSEGWLSSSSRTHIIDHEVGHALHVQTLDPKEFDKVYDARFTDAQKSLVRAHVSGYAATLPVEFVAETYAGVKAGKVYPPEIHELYRKMGGPRLPGGADAGS